MGPPSRRVQEGTPRRKCYFSSFNLKKHECFSNLKLHSIVKGSKSDCFNKTSYMYAAVIPAEWFCLKHNTNLRHCQCQLQVFWMIALGVNVLLICKGRLRCYRVSSCLAIYNLSFVFQVVQANCIGALQRQSLHWRGRKVGETSPLLHFCCHFIVIFIYFYFTYLLMCCIKLLFLQCGSCSITRIW